MKTQLDPNKERGVSDDECDRLISYLSETIDSLFLQISGKSEQY